MGQYFKICNLDKKEFLHPHRFGDGLKLLEFGCSSHGTLTALTILLRQSEQHGGGDLDSDRPIVGSWAGDRIVVAGDYANSGIWSEEAMLGTQRLNIYQSAGDLEELAIDCDPQPTIRPEDNWRDVSADVMEAMFDDEWIREAILEQANAGYCMTLPETVAEVQKRRGEPVTVPLPKDDE